jgi:hypothetical protein
MHFSKGQIIVGMDFVYPEGALRVEDVETDGTLVAYPMGGGFQMKFKPEAVAKNRFRVVPQEAIDAAPYKAGQFVIDCWEDTRFGGWWNGERWNGWAKPIFSLKEARLIMTMFNQDGGGKATFEEAKDRFVFLSEHDDQPMICAGIQLPGVPEKVYPVGTGEWTWSEAPEPAREDDEDEE